MLKHSQVILCGTLNPTVCNFPFSLLCNSIPETDCDYSFWAISLISFMTLRTAYPVATFHRSHSVGLNLLGSYVASLIISGNQLWSGQQGVTMISFPSHFTSVPRTSLLSLGVEGHISVLLAITSLALVLKFSCLTGLCWNTAGLCYVLLL